MFKKLLLTLFLISSLLMLTSCEEDNIENVWVYNIEGVNITIAAIQYKDGIFRVKDNKGAVDRKASWRYSETTPNVIFITADIEEDIGYWERIYFNEKAAPYLRKNKAYFDLASRTMGLAIEQDDDDQEFIILMRHQFYRIENEKK